MMGGGDAFYVALLVTAVYVAVQGANPRWATTLGEKFAKASLRSLWLVRAFVRVVPLGLGRTVLLFVLVGAWSVEVVRITLALARRDESLNWLAPEVLLVAAIVVYVGTYFLLLSRDMTAGRVKLVVGLVAAGGGAWFMSRVAPPDPSSFLALAHSLLPFIGVLAVSALPLRGVSARSGRDAPEIK